MGRSTSQVALKTIMNTKMIEGTLIRNYMTHITRLFNKMGIPRAKNQWWDQGQYDLRDLIGFLQIV